MSSQNDLHIQTTILQAAKQLLSRPGDTGNTAVSFTIDDLAAKTGLSRATIYRHAGGKKAILQKLAAESGHEALNQPNVADRILHAARTLFGQYGLTSPTMEQIAAEAGVGVATVYRHFGDKSTLLKTFLRAYQPKLTTDAKELSGDLTTDLTQLVATMIQFISQNQDMVRLSFANHNEWLTELSNVRPFQERNLNRVAHFLQRYIDSGQLQPIDPHQAATALLGMILSFSMILPTYYNLPNPNPKETAVFITHLFLKGLQTSGENPHDPAA